MSLFLHQDLLKRCELLANMTQPMSEQLVSKLRRLFFAPGEFVLVEGEKGEDMYFITHGLVQVKKKCVATTWLLREGASFGEMALMPFGLPIRNSYSIRQIVATAGRRNASVQCVDYCEMMMLHHDDLTAVLHMPEATASRMDVKRVYLQRAMMVELIATDETTMKQNFKGWKDATLALRAERTMLTHMGYSHDGIQLLQEMLHCEGNGVDDNPHDADERYDKVDD